MINRRNFFLVNLVEGLDQDFINKKKLDHDFIEIILDMSTLS